MKKILFKITRKISLINMMLLLLLYGNFVVLALPRNIISQSSQLQLAENASAGDNLLSCRLIYCTGPLLNAIQMGSVFQDSKTFVDMPLQRKPELIIEAFNSLMKSHNNSLTKTELKQFIKENFNEAGHELVNWTPHDWIKEPQFLDRIRNKELRQWGIDLNALWKILGRKMIDDVNKNQEFYSIIYVKNPVIVPGGRFREFYYWDSYWIIRGLLRCEMYETAKGMLENFLSIIQRFGFIPNGGRVYYLTRSQPPLLAPMIKSYVDATDDDIFAIENVDTLAKEFDFFWNNYMHQVGNVKLAAYGGIKSNRPRPESYREDMETANAFNTDEDKMEFYNHINAAAESGMDFSSRFFMTSNGSVYGTLKDIKAGNIISVELNAYLYWDAKIIAEFYRKSGKNGKANDYEEKAELLKFAINNVLWNDTVGVWLDWDIEHGKHRNYFVATNLSPLWMKCYNIMDSEKISKKVLNYLLNETNVDLYPGGVPNTLYFSSEQWDLPNVWPPMEYMLIIGLDNLGTKDAKNLARKWAQRWVLSNYAAYKDEHHMYEKYNAEEFGGHGGGGEYDVQIGFGWSNGVIIELLEKYGHILQLLSDGNKFGFIALPVLVVISITTVMM